MTKLRIVLAATLLSLGFGALPSMAQEAAQPDIVKQHWTFAGLFGTFDQNQLQRGFQIFQDVCSQCHTARLLAFRNLSEEGGPAFSEQQVKALAASMAITDADAPPPKEGDPSAPPAGKRWGLPSDHWPGPDLSPADLKATYGVVPPDFSVIAKARSVHPKFPDWIFNYFTTYSEGGPDYIHALLNGYHEAPAGFALPAGKFYNDVFPGHAIGMPPPLTDGLVAYADPAAVDGQPAPAAVPKTVEQYSEDVSAFLMWMADPHLVERKAAGFRVILFLALFAVLMYLSTRRLWRNVEH